MVKNQHYIPRFLLKNFSEDENKKYLTVYLLNEKRIISKASIKNQASKDYIYGKDQTIENILQNIENETAITFSKILRNENISDVEKEVLKLFVCLQMNRTPFNEKNNNEMVDLVFKNMYSNHPIIGKHIKKIKLELCNPCQLSILNSIKTSRLLSDLAINTLDNNSEIPFILGQQPAYIINPYLFEKNIDFFSQGIAIKGICIFLPISFKRMIIMYDRWCYSLIKKDGKIEISNDDITKLNKFQFYYTSDCIFIKKNMDINYLNMLSNSTQNYRDEEFLKLKVVKVNDQKLLYEQTKIPNMDPNISFMRIKNQAFCQNLLPHKKCLVRTTIIPELIKIENMGVQQ